MAVVRDVALGEERPARQGLPQCADAALVAGGGLRPLRPAREPRLPVERQPVVLVDVRQDRVHCLLHLHPLLAVVQDAGGVETAAVAGRGLDLVANAMRLLDVLGDGRERARLHPGHVLELLCVGEVVAELQAVEARFHAIADAVCRRHAPVRRQEHVGIAALHLCEPDRFREPGHEERLAQIEAAELLDAEVAHLAHDAAEESPGHVALLTQSHVRGAEEALEVAACRELDLDALRNRRRFAAVVVGQQRDPVDALGDAHGFSPVQKNRRNAFGSCDPGQFRQTPGVKVCCQRPSRAQ